MLLADAEELLDFRWLVAEVWIVDLLGVKPLHLLFRDKTALVAEPLFCQILPTVVSDFLDRATLVLLVPVGTDLEQA